MKAQKRLEYALSENSKRSTQDFKTANRIASLIYQVFKSCMPRIVSRAQYQRLCKHIIKIMHAGSTVPLGQRTLYHGNVSQLKGFQLNPYTTLRRIIRFQPEIEVLPEKQVLEIFIPAIAAADVSAPVQAVSLSLQMICCEVDADNYLIDTHWSVPLEIPLKGKELKPARKLPVPLPDMEGKVLLVIAIVNTYCSDSHQHGNQVTPYQSNDRRYYAGELIGAYYVKDGKLVLYEAEQPASQATAYAVNRRMEIPWEEV